MTSASHDAVSDRTPRQPGPAGDELIAVLALQAVRELIAYLQELRRARPSASERTDPEGAERA